MTAKQSICSGMATEQITRENSGNLNYQSQQVEPIDTREDIFQSIGASQWAADQQNRDSKMFATVAHNSTVTLLNDEPKAALNDTIIRATRTKS